jgi:hypothetical protein
VGRHSVVVRMAQHYILGRGRTDRRAALVALPAGRAK